VTEAQKDRRYYLAKLRRLMRRGIDDAGQKRLLAKLKLPDNAPLSTYPDWTDVARLLGELQRVNAANAELRRWLRAED
jgi:hypothetical protein